MSLDKLIGFIKSKDVTGLRDYLALEGSVVKNDLGVALLYACTKQVTGKTDSTHPQIVEVLIEAGAPIEHIIAPSDAHKYYAIFGGASFVLNQEATPLSLAVRWDVNPDVVKLLVDSGANVFARVKDGQSPLHFVAAHTTAGGLSALDIVLAKYQSEKAAGNPLANIDMHDSSSMTPAMWATRQNLEGLKKLVEAGASITKSAFNKTTLGLALKPEIEVYITEQLIAQHGEDILYKGISPDTTRAIRPELWNLVDKFTTPLGTDKLVAALEMLKGKGLLERALSYKLDVEGSKCVGQTILHHGAEVGSPAIVQVLLRYGANPDGLDGVKNTIPLIQSFSLNSDPRTTELLVSVTSPEALVAKYGIAGRELSVLHIAANRPGLIKTLLELAPGKFDVDQQAGKEHFGNTVLHIAAENLLFDDVEALLHAGARTDIRNVGGNTALDRMTGDTFYSQYPEMIPAGATMQKIDYKQGQKMMVKLLQAGAQAWTTDLSPKGKGLDEYPVTELFRPYLIETILTSGDKELIADCLSRLDYQKLDIYKMTCEYGADKGMLLLHKIALSSDTTGLGCVLDHLKSQGKLQKALEYVTSGASSDHDGEQLLYAAAKYGSAAAVKMLVDGGYKANPNMKHATKGAIPLVGALVSNSDEVVEFLLSRTMPTLLAEKYGPAKNLSVLFCAASAAKSGRAIELVLQKMPKGSYNPDETVNIGGTDQTYLELALAQGNVGNAVALINAGARVDFVSNVDGHNALDQALVHYMDVMQKGMLPLVAQMQQAQATIQKQQATINKFLPQIATLEQAQKYQLKMLQEQLEGNKVILSRMISDFENGKQELNKVKATVKAFLKCGGEFAFFTDKGEVAGFVAEIMKEELSSLLEDMRKYAAMLVQNTQGITFDGEIEESDKVMFKALIKWAIQNDFINIAVAKITEKAPLDPTGPAVMMSDPDLQGLIEQKLTQFVKDGNSVMLDRWFSCVDPSMEAALASKLFILNSDVYTSSTKEVFDILVQKHHADPKAELSDHTSAAIHAAHLKYPKAMFQLLKNLGANLSAKDHTGHDAYDIIQERLSHGEFDVPTVGLTATKDFLAEFHH